MRCNERSDRRPPVVLQGLTNILGAASFKVVASCSGGTNCIQAIRSLASDIAIIDISMPGLTGLEILAIANSRRSFHAPGLFHRVA
jgi:two-component system, NarL family, nitrate/nitrite response regulator NarL